MCSDIRENCGDRQGNEEMVQAGNGAKTNAKRCMAASAEARAIASAMSRCESWEPWRRNGDRRVARTIFRWI
jgi:hypothetical protein